LLSGLPADAELVADDSPAVSVLAGPLGCCVQDVSSGAQVLLGGAEPGQDVDLSGV